MGYDAVSIRKVIDVSVGLTVFIFRVQVNQRRHEEFCLQISKTSRKPYSLLFFILSPEK
jgi:hypothetical protein